MNDFDEVKTTTTNKRIQEEIRKSTDVLAKLMAKENLTIIDGGVETSAIDMDKRIVYIVKFNHNSPLACKEVRTTSISHEIGHALFTPPTLMHEAIKQRMPNLSQYVNIVEDIRIEKLIKNQYKGLHATMQAGRKVMLDNNIFGLSAKLSPNTLEYANKLILYTKVGSVNSKVKFSVKEEAVLRFIERTAVDEKSVIDCAKFLFLFCEERKNEESRADFSEECDFSNDSEYPEEWDENIKTILPPEEDDSEESTEGTSEESTEDTPKNEGADTDSKGEAADEQDDSTTENEIESIGNLYKKAQESKDDIGEEFKSLDDLAEKLMRHHIDEKSDMPIMITNNNVSKHIKKVIPTLKLKRFNIS